MFYFFVNNFGSPTKANFIFIARKVLPRDHRFYCIYLSLTFTPVNGTNIFFLYDTVMLQKVSKFQNSVNSFISIIIVSFRLELFIAVFLVYPPPANKKIVIALLKVDLCLL